VVVSIFVLLFLFGTAFALFFALWATRTPEYSGPDKLKQPDRPTVGF
jgi:hypothetical protein